MRLSGSVASTDFVGSVEDHSQHAATAATAAGADRSNGDGSASWQADSLGKWQQKRGSRGEQQRERCPWQAAIVATTDAAAAHHLAEPVAQHQNVARLESDTNASWIKDNWRGGLRARHCSDHYNLVPVDGESATDYTDATIEKQHLQRTLTKLMPLSFSLFIYPCSNLYSHFP